MSLNYRIRPVRRADAAQINAIRRDPEVGRTLLALPTERLEFTSTFLENTSETEHHFVAVEERSERVLGMASLHQHTEARRRHIGEIGIMVARDAQGQGIGRALMNVLLDLADNWLCLDRVFLTVFTRNARAENLYRSLGFEEEALWRQACVQDGSYADELAMARFRPGFAAGGSPLADDSENAWEKREETRLPHVIRNLRREDCVALAALRAEKGSLANAEGLSSAREVQAFAWYDGLGMNELFYVAAAQAQQDVPLGLAKLELKMNPRGKHAAAVSMLVSEAVQGTDADRGLLEAVVALADNWLLLRRLEAKVLVCDGRARQLYKDLGFEEEGRYRCSVSASGGYADEIALARLRPTP